MAVTSPPIPRVPNPLSRGRYSQEMNAARIIADIREMERRLAEEMKKEAESPSLETWNRVQAELEVNAMLKGEAYQYRPWPGAK